ncbi:serine hydrolase [Colwelliaceae bacterium 6441]
MKSHKKSNSTITTLMITLFICIISSANSHATSDLEKISTIVNHKFYQENLGVGVAIAIIDGDKTEFLNIGVADQVSNQAVTSATLFEIGSITKTFTATALASMAIEEKINLSDPIAPYLKSSVSLSESNDKPITFLSLANHSSGLPRLPNNMPFSDPLDPYADYSIEMMYQFLNNYTPTRGVGEQAEYSNLGAGLLGHLLSLIDNKSYQSMLNERVLKPLNMSNTFIDVPLQRLKELSDGHNEQLNKTKHWQLPALAGAGAIKSNTIDMVKYLHANMTKELLSEQFTLTQTATSPFGSPNTKIGLSWIINNGKSNSFYMHNGGTGGFRSFIGFDPKQQKGIVILANSVFDMDDIGYAYLTNTLDKIVLNKPVSVDEKQLAKLNGKFELVPNFVLTVTHEKDQLFVQATGQPKLSLKAVSATEFINQAVKARVVFEINNQGEAQSLTLFQGGQTLPGKKL